MCIVLPVVGSRRTVCRPSRWSVSAVDKWQARLAEASRWTPVSSSPPADRRHDDDHVTWRHPAEWRPTCPIRHQHGRHCRQVPDETWPLELGRPWPQTRRPADCGRPGWRTMKDPDASRLQVPRNYTRHCVIYTCTQKHQARWSSDENRRRKKKNPC